MNPTNPANQGKWMAFAAIGYDVENPQSRNAAAQDVINQLRQSLVSVPATQSQSSIYGLRYQVRVQIQDPMKGKEPSLQLGRLTLAGMFLG